jgi:hypothetical protein
VIREPSRWVPQQGDAKEAAVLWHSEVPADFDDRPSHVHQEPGAGGTRGWRDSGVAPSGEGCPNGGYAAVERAQRARTPAVGPIVDDAMRPVRQIGRADDLKIRAVADGAVRIARTIIDVDDDGIERIVRMDLAGEGAGNDLIGSNRTQSWPACRSPRRPAECW